MKTQSVLEFGLTSTLEIMNLGFSDYFVPIQLDLAHFAAMLRTDGIDLTLSRVVFKDDQAVGIALIARRGWSSRLAGMAIIPEVRSKGVGHWLMTQLIAESKERGDQRMELEVIEQNKPALKLYQGMGFTILRRLVSYAIDKPLGVAAEELEQIDIRDLADLVNFNGIHNLPWQLSGESLAQNGPPTRAYQLNDAFIAITDPAADQVIIRSILVMPDQRGWGQGTNLLQAVFAQFPGKRWVVPAIFPEETAVFFEKLGFERQTLSQFQMELDFDIS